MLCVANMFLKGGKCVKYVNSKFLMVITKLRRTKKRDIFVNLTGTTGQVIHDQVQSKDTLAVLQYFVNTF